MPSANDLENGAQRIDNEMVKKQESVRAYWRGTL